MEFVRRDVIPVSAIHLDAVRVALEAVARDDIVVTEQHLDALRGFRIGVGRAEDVARDQVEGGAARELQPVAIVEEFVALDLVVDGRSRRRAAISIIAGQHHARAAVIGHDAAVFDDIAAGTMDQHADAEIADFQPADPDALRVDDREPRIGRRADIGAELARHRARAGLLAFVLDESGTVEDKGQKTCEGAVPNSPARFHGLPSMRTGPLMAGSSEAGLMTCGPTPAGSISMRKCPGAVLLRSMAQRSEPSMRSSPVRVTRSTSGAVCANAGTGAVSRTATVTTPSEYKCNLSSRRWPGGCTDRCRAARHQIRHQISASAFSVLRSSEPPTPVTWPFSIRTIVVAMRFTSAALWLT